MPEADLIESLKRGYPCRSDGDEVPWMNYSIVSILNDRLRPDMKLFEFGSGYSTLFYAKRVNRVASVEYDRGWFDRMQSRVPPHPPPKWVPLQAGWIGAGDYPPFTSV